MSAGGLLLIYLFGDRLVLAGAPVAHPIIHWVTDKLLAPAMVAVVFSGLTNIVIERFKAKRDQATKLCDGLRADVSELQKLVGDYWSRESKPGDALVEARILSLQSEVLETASLLAEEFELAIAGDAFLASMADALTGGEFGAATRVADNDRLKASSSLLSDLRGRITRERWRRMKKTGW